MKTKKYLCFWMAITYFITGCSAFRKNKMQVDLKSIEIKIGPKKVDVDAVISKLAQQISLTLSEKQKRKVAVMNFTLPTGEITELGLYVSDKFTNSLFLIQDKFEVVERNRIKSVLAEMELGFTGIIDAKTAQSVGKMSGADAIIIGTITDLEDEVDINVRMLGTERGNVIAVANSLLKKNEAIDRLMENIVMESGKKVIKERKTKPAIKPVKIKKPQLQKVTNKSNLVAYYPFNGNANDESGNGNNGKLINQASTTVSGKIGNGVILDGVNDNINLGTQVLNNPTAGTVSFWLKPTVNGSSGTRYIWLNTTVLSKGALYMALQITSTNKIRIYYYDPAYQKIDSNTAIEVNSWNYVTYTWNDSGSQIYINGVLDKISALTWTNVETGHLNTPAKIGIEQWGRNYFYTGFIDEVRIYNRALSESAIKVLFEKKTSQLQKSPYNATSDFSAVDGNPNGVWSYGWMPLDFSTFNLYTGSQMNESSPQWYREPESGGYCPMIWRIDDNHSRNFVAVGELSLHPSSTKEASVLRWTAPMDGLYNIDGQFLKGDSGIMQVGIRHGSNWLWQGVDSGSFNLDKSLIAGESIDFLVYGGYGFGNTPIELTITPIKHFEKEGLIAYYPFNGNANDKSGIGNNGTVHGATLSKDRFKNENSAYSFDGDDYIDVGNNKVFNFGDGTNNFTIGAWIYRISSASSGASGGIVSKARENPFAGWAFATYENGRLSFSGVGIWEIVSPTNIPLNQWVHVAVTRNVNTYKLYIDGVEVASKYRSNNLETYSGILIIGATYLEWQPSRFFTGMIDKVFIYNRALTTEEIAGKYQE